MVRQGIRIPMGKGFAGRVAAVEDEIREAVSNQPAIVSVDLTDLTYMDSAGVRILFTLASRLQALRIALELIVHSALPPAGSSSYRGSSRLLRSNQRTPNRSPPAAFARSPKRPCRSAPGPTAGRACRWGQWTGTELRASRVISIYPYLYATRRRR